MYNLLFRKAFFPLLDAANGTQILKILKFLEQSQWWSEERLLQLQKTKLRNILSWAQQNSSFYLQHWKEAPEEKRAASLHPELSGLPIVDKEDLRWAGGQFPLSAYKKPVREYQTSGSTGAPMTFFRSVEQESWFWAIRFRMWQWAGYRLGDPYLAINLNPRLAWKKRLQDRFFRCCYLNYNTDNQDSERILDCLSSGGIRHINGFSSSLFALARYMERHGIRHTGLSGITATGDDLFPQQRELIEKMLGVRVTDYYGAGGEGMHLASQCEALDQYHVHMENSIVELIKDGRPARAGEVGEVVVTQFEGYAMPLIRYRLGDIATVSDGIPCSCGRGLQSIASINGRSCDVVFAPNGAALLPQFFFIGAFKALEKVRRYQILQERLESVTVKLVAETGCDRKKAEASLREEISRATSDSLRVDFDWVEKIALSGRGKPRVILSNLKDRSPVAVGYTPPSQGDVRIAEVP